MRSHGSHGGGLLSSASQRKTVLIGVGIVVVFLMLSSSFGGGDTIRPARRPVNKETEAPPSQSHLRVRTWSLPVHSVCRVAGVCVCVWLTAGARGWLVVRPTVWAHWLLCAEAPSSAEGSTPTATDARTHCVSRCS